MRCAVLLAACTLAIEAVLFGSWSGPALADSVVATRMLRAQSVLDETDVALRAGGAAGALSDTAEAIGMETRTTIYAGRPIRAEDLMEPAIVERNQVVPLNYFHGGLAIATDGRVLERAGPGARVRVMNLGSRTTVVGTVMVDGSVTVAPASN